MANYRKIMLTGLTALLVTVAVAGMASDSYAQRRGRGQPAPPPPPPNQEKHCSPEAPKGPGRCTINGVVHEGMTCDTCKTKCSGNATCSWVHIYKETFGGTCVNGSIPMFNDEGVEMIDTYWVEEDNFEIILDNSCEDPNANPNPIDEIMNNGSSNGGGGGSDEDPYY